MNFKSFPFKFTCLVGFAFLGSVFWLGAAPGWMTFLGVPILFLLFLAGGLTSLIAASCERSDTNMCRLFINAIVLALGIPILWFGVFVRGQIFLFELPRYQEVTDLLVKNEKAKSTEFRGAVILLPAHYTDLSETGTVALKCDADDIVDAMFFSGCAGALHHEGYVFRSNDDLTGLKRDFPDLGFKRLTTNWYHWAD